MKIIDCTIEKNVYTSTIYVTFEDCSFKKLYTYYNDELYFDKSEFMGLNENQAYDLIHKKDIAYLRS